MMRGPSTARQAGLTKPLPGAIADERKRSRGGLALSPEREPGRSGTPKRVVFRACYWKSTASLIAPFGDQAGECHFAGSFIRFAKNLAEIRTDFERRTFDAASSDISAAADPKPGAHCRILCYRCVKVADQITDGRVPWY